MTEDVNSGTMMAPTITRNEALTIATSEWEAGLREEASVRATQIRTGGLGLEAVARIGAATDGWLVREYHPYPPLVMEWAGRWRVQFGEHYFHAPWVEVNARTGDVTGRGVPEFLPFWRPEKRAKRARYLAWGRWFRRLPPLRVTHDEALETALVAYGRKEAERVASHRAEFGQEPFKENFPHAAPYADEGLEHWRVNVRPGYRPGVFVWIDGQTRTVR